jgi:hypothetical protein
MTAPQSFFGARRSRVTKFRVLTASVIVFPGKDASARGNFATGCDQGKSLSPDASSHARNALTGQATSPKSVDTLRGYVETDDDRTSIDEFSDAELTAMLRQRLKAEAVETDEKD